MFKKMQIDKYEFQIYPRDLWIVIGKDADKMSKLFTFYYTDKRKIINENVKDIVDEPNFAAMTCSVADNKTTKYGVLLYIPNIKDFLESDISHEAVHIADYIFQEMGMNTENFEQGNEHYAYLVGWIAGRIANSLIKNKEYAKYIKAKYR